MIGHSFCPCNTCRLGVDECFGQEYALVATDSACCVHVVHSCDQLQDVHLLVVAAVTIVAVQDVADLCDVRATWQVTLLTRAFDIALMCGLAYTPTGTGAVREALVALHLARTAFANCTRPLTRSLLMDNVPKVPLLPSCPALWVPSSPPLLMPLTKLVPAGSALCLCIA